MDINPNANIGIQSSNSTAGIMGVQDGIFDLGTVSRDLREQELEILTETPNAMPGILASVILAVGRMAGETATHQEPTLSCKRMHSNPR